MYNTWRRSRTYDKVTEVAGHKGGAESREPAVDGGKVEDSDLAGGKIREGEAHKLSVLFDRGIAILVRCKVSIVAGRKTTGKPPETVADQGEVHNGDSAGGEVCQ